MPSSTVLILLGVAGTLIVLGSAAAVLVAVRASRETTRVASALETLARQLDQTNGTLTRASTALTGEMNRTIAHALAAGDPGAVRQHRPRARGHARHDRREVRRRSPSDSAI